MNPASFYLQRPSGLREGPETRSVTLPDVRKKRAGRRKTSEDCTRERLLEEVTFEKYKRTRQGRGSKSLEEKPAGGKASRLPLAEPS